MAFEFLNEIKLSKINKPSHWIFGDVFEQINEIEIFSHRANLIRDYQKPKYNHYVLDTGEYQISCSEYNDSNILDFEVLGMRDPALIEALKFLNTRKIPHELHNDEEIMISNYKRYFKIVGEFRINGDDEDDLDEITIKPTFPLQKGDIVKFIGHHNFDMDNKWVEFRGIPEDRQDIYLFRYDKGKKESGIDKEYVINCLKNKTLIKRKKIQEITIKTPHPLDKIKLLKFGTQVYSEFKINGRTYKISGEVRYISGPDTNDNHYFIIIHKNNRGLVTPEEYLDIPADKDEYKFHQQRAAKGEFLGKQPFGTLFLDNMKIISQPKNELDEIEIKGGPGFIVSPKIDPTNFYGDVDKAVFKIDYNKILEWCKKTDRNYNLTVIKEIVRQWKEKQLKGRKMSPKDISKYDKWLFLFLSTVLQTQTKKKINEIEVKPKFIPKLSGKFGTVRPKDSSRYDLAGVAYDAGSYYAFPQQDYTRLGAPVYKLLFHKKSEYTALTSFKKISKHIEKLNDLIKQGKYEIRN